MDTSIVKLENPEETPTPLPKKTKLTTSEKAAAIAEKAAAAEAAKAEKKEAWVKERLRKNKEAAQRCRNRQRGKLDALILRVNEHSAVITQLVEDVKRLQEQKTKE